MTVEQRISVAQLNELSDEQKEKLSEQWEPQTYDIFYCGGKIRTVTLCSREKPDGPKLVWYHGGHATKGCCYPLLSIGQCLELLEQLSNDGFYAIDRRTDKNGSREYAVIMDMFKSADKELIITLWQAVKAVL